MNNAQWKELAAAACDDAGIKQESLEIITTWDQKFEHVDLFRNNAVFRINNQYILKIVGTDALWHFNIERAVLQTLSEEIPAPRLIASGIIDNGSPFIIMSEIAGQTLQNAWDELSPLELRQIAREIGAITAQLHRQPEWDIAFHWFWTFSQDRDTMRECLQAYYQDRPRPDRFARRCFATHFYTYSMNEVWDYFTESVDDSESIVRAMITSLFPSEIFGAPD